MNDLNSEQSPWVEGKTVGAVLRQTAKMFAGRDAVVFPRLGLRWSWAELDRRVDVVASALIQQGIGLGCQVGIWSMNAPEWVVTQFAVARTGAVLVNINPSYRLHELEETLRAADVDTLVVGSPFKGSNFVEMVQTLCPEVTRATSPSWHSERLSLMKRLIAIESRPGPGWLAWLDLEGSEIIDAVSEREASIDALDVHNIQFTSGTTGMPKGAMLTHRNVLMNAFYVGKRLRYTELDRVCVPVPFYHCFGCVLGTLVCAVTGAALIAPSPTFDAEATLHAVSTERCTSLYGVPTMFVAVLGHADLERADLSHLRTGIMAGSPCPLPLMRQVVEVLGATEMTIGYGQTEASPIITQTSADDPVEVRVGTVGRPIPGVEVRLIDPLTHKDVEQGGAGELCTRGHCVMHGYYKNPEATLRAVDEEGWLHTGDLARVNPDGNYRIVGRCKELIIRGGENIYPPEIEEFLHHHPGVAEVAVVGLPDTKYGEVIGAWVVARQGVSLVPDELREYCRGQIAHFKIPQYIQVVDQLPRTVTGKVRKHVLRDQGISTFSLHDAASLPTA